MTTDELVRRALHDLTDDINAEPEPAARVRRRLRRSRRRWRIGSGLAALLAVGAGWVALPAGDAPVDFVPRRVWSQRLYEAAPRGAVAAGDPAFVRALADAAQRDFGGYMPDFHARGPRVLYADDLGAHRFAIVAFEGALVQPTDSAGNPAEDGEYVTVTYMAARGADAATLAQSFNSAGPGLPPLYSAAFLDGDGPTTVGVVALAPPDCTFATARAPQLDDWQPEPTGSYLARDSAPETPQWWRVICDGVVRQQSPAELPILEQSPSDTSDERIDQLSQTARGTVNRVVARDALTNLRLGPSPLLAGEPRLLWGGAVTWPDDNDDTLRASSGVIAVQPFLVDAGWSGVLAIRYDQPDVAGSVGELAPFVTSNDPSAANAVVPIRMGARSNRVLVLAPAAAAKVRVVDNGQPVTESVVDHGVAAVDVASPATVEYQALDTNGQVIGSGRIEDRLVSPKVVAWDQP